MQVFTTIRCSHVENWALPRYLADSVHHLQKHLLGGIGRGCRIAVEVIQGNRIDPILMRLVELTPGLAVAPLAGLEQRRADAAR